MEFYVSTSGIARWLVQINVPEPSAREILARVRQAIAQHPAYEWGGQMVALSRATVALGEHGPAYRAWICSLESLSDREQMVEDWCTGTYVAHAETVVTFLHKRGVRAEVAVFILLAVQHHSLHGVITLRRWNQVIPECMMQSWLEFIGVPHDSAAALIPFIPQEEVVQ